MENQKETDFINEKKQEILGLMKAGGIDKTGAEAFLNMLKTMIIENLNEENGVTPEMKIRVTEEWPNIKKEILEGYEG